MNKKLVSVIIPTFKRADTLHRAVESVLKQDYHNIEVIVVDDNNPDTKFRKETEKVMDRYINNSRVKYIKHECNKNGSAARNTGFKNSSGEYIMFLDDDDEFLQGKITAQVNCLEERDKEWGACYTRYIRKKNNKIIMKCAETREGNLLVEELKRNLFVHAGSNLMVRREVFIQMGGFDESFQRNQDIEFLVRVLRKYKLGFVDVMGLVVYVHPRTGLQSFEDLTKQYVEKFGRYINELDIEQQNQIHRMINLQVFRSKISKVTSFSGGLDMVKTGEVVLWDVIRYIVHLFARKITKKSCGFTL